MMLVQLLSFSHAAEHPQLEQAQQESVVQVERFLLQELAELQAAVALLQLESVALLEQLLLGQKPAFWC